MWSIEQLWIWWVLRLWKTWSNSLWNILSKIIKNHNLIATTIATMQKIYIYIYIYREREREGEKYQLNVSHWISGVILFIVKYLWNIDFIFHWKP